MGIKIKVEVKALIEVELDLENKSQLDAENMSVRESDELIKEYIYVKHGISDVRDIRVLPYA